MKNSTENINLKVDIAGVDWNVPVTSASGTFGSGREFARYYDLSILGAVTVKGVSSVPWQGNPPPRVAETYGGMLNAVGLQNPGVEKFIKEDIPFLRQFDTKIIVNIGGRTVEEYAEVANMLKDENIDMLELNISCPNVKEGGHAFGTDPKAVFEVTEAVKKSAKQPLIVKLSPNVTDIAETAKAAEAAGADAVSLINTLIGMKIDINTRKPILFNKQGGLSGPAIHPVAVRMVYQVYKTVKVPIIGMGGISTADDAIEMLLAGASAVAVGTANFNDPYAIPKIVDGIKQYMLKYNLVDVRELTGAAHD